MNRVNIRRPKMVSCGVPRELLKTTEVVFPINTENLQSFKKECIHSFMGSPKPRIYIRLRITNSLLVMSKAGYY